MKHILFDLLAAAYVATGIVGIVAYWPTIKDLYKNKPSANVLSYVLWTVGNGIAFLYSIFILPDLLFIVVSGFNFLSCAIILLLALRIKR